jgi:rare lipoprotein A
MSPSLCGQVDGSRAARRASFWGALGILTLSCQTPPPLARSTPEESPPREQAPRNVPPPPPPATAGADPTTEPKTAAPAPDHRELESRYDGRPALRTIRGEASYYGAAFAGRKTASGEVFDPGRFTAAHRTLPFGTVLRVTRVDTGAVVYVRVNDRGPFGKARRILDLSSAAADRLDMLRRGIAEVRAEIVEHGPKPTRRPKKKRSRSARN